MWSNNLVQFARLLCEINATQDNLSIDALCESMDLYPSDIQELFDRAHEYWEGYKVHGLNSYSSSVESVSKLVRKVISMDDAIEIVSLLNGSIRTMVHFGKGQFQRDVYAHIGYRLPMSYPLHKNILSKR